MIKMKIVEKKAVNEGKSLFIEILVIVTAFFSIVANNLIIGVDTLLAYIEAGLAILVAIIVANTVLAIETQNYTVLVNIRGLIIPITISSSFITRVAIMYPHILGHILFAVLIASIISYLASQYIRGYGIGLPILIPILSSISLAGIMISVNNLHPLLSSPVAYFISTFSVLIGLDILKLLFITKQSRILFEIGGGGFFDMLFLTGPLSTSMSLAITMILLK